MEIVTSPAPTYSRRRWLGLVAGATSAAAVPIYAHGIEAEWLEVNEITIPLGRAKPSGIRILHMSDLHVTPDTGFDYLNRAIDLGLALDPDIVCVTGDFITRTEGLPENYAPVLARLPQAKPTFACTGNHDLGSRDRLGNSDAIRAFLAQSQVLCPHNSHVEITIRGESLQIVSLGDLWTGECDPTDAFPPNVGQRPARIVLSHNPDSKDVIRAYDWDVMLAGHTHGGQNGIPVLKRFMAPVKDKRYIEGLHRWADRWLHISRGLGNLHGVRFLCRPQITLVTLA